MPFSLNLAEEFRGVDGELGEHRFKSMKYMSQIFHLAAQKELSHSQITGIVLESIRIDEESIQID